MMDLYLRAGNAGALASACPFLRGEDEEGNRFWLTTGDGFALDVIGPIVTAPGKYDEEGREKSPPVMDERFHANLRCTEEVAAMVPDTVRVTPEKPSRVWA
ncbi:hypothetical protein [Agrobacterium pusense]|uniref:hypothetical protein n=1 Tax=Agrobacterium pusense TaxID=648995 RepID=UPI00068AAFD9|nr:hypothetical protein [Agrobacterium pusense]QWW74710.1 hypothetical protein KP800_04300 [Agrobacterium pusense]